MTTKIIFQEFCGAGLLGMLIQCSHCYFHQSLLDSQVKDRTVLIGQGTDMMPTISSAINSHGSSQG